MTDINDPDIRKLIKIVNRLKKRKIFITTIGNTNNDPVLINYNLPETEDDNDRVICIL
jgi:soluble P-type ATPase